MRDLPPLQWLRVFEASARHLSFTQAARELNITQSAVSQQIKLLENELGQLLFERRPRSLQLTNTGYQYLPDIQSALAILRESTRAHFATSDQHSITIRSNWAFSALWLSRHIGDFLCDYPQLSVNIVPAMWESEYREKGDSIQIHFGSGPVSSDKIMLSANLQCFPVCSPDIAKQLTRLEDLLNFPQINTSGFLKQWDDYYQYCNLDSQGKSQVQHTTPAFIVAFEMARNNLGIALGHNLILGDLLSSGRLVKPFEQSMPIDENYYLTCDANNQTLAEQQFCDWIQDRLGV